MMKNKYLVMTALLAAILMTGLCACNKVTLSGEIKDEKHMEIVADNADKGDYMMSGGLEVEDGQQIVTDYDLEKGKIEIALIREAEEQSEDELPDTDAEPEQVVEVSGTGGGSSQVPAGDYMVKVTCTEKAKGTVNLTVAPFSEE